MDRTPQSEAEDLYSGEDDPDLYVVLGFDPGGTTGWSLIGVHPDAIASGDPEIRVLENILFWSAGQFEGLEDQQCDQMVEMVHVWPSARLVTEQFVLRSQVRSRDITALERMNAVLLWAVRPRYFVQQQPSLAMTTVTDERQKAMGLWIPGQEHARDATKHVLTFLKRQRDRNLKAAAAAASAGTK